MYVYRPEVSRSPRVSRSKDKLLVGTTEGIFSFQKNGASWSKQETMVPGKHFSSIIFEPTTQSLFGGTYSGEIYFSADLGKTWERRDSGIGEKEIYSLASQIVNGKAARLCRNPAGASVLQRRSGQELDGAARSTQVPGVEKWTFPGEPHLAHAKSITFHPTDPNIIHVAVEVGGFLRSTDGGKTWSDARQHQSRRASRLGSRPTIRASSTARRRRPTADPKRSPVSASAATAARAGRA